MLSLHRTHSSVAFIPSIICTNDLRSRDGDCKMEGDALFSGPERVAVTIIVALITLVAFVVLHLEVFSLSRAFEALGLSRALKAFSLSRALAELDSWNGIAPARVVSLMRDFADDIDVGEAGARALGNIAREGAGRAACIAASAPAALVVLARQQSVKDRVRTISEVARALCNMAADSDVGRAACIAAAGGGFGVVAFGHWFHMPWPCLTPSSRPGAGEYAARAPTGCAGSMRAL